MNCPNGHGELIGGPAWQDKQILHCYTCGDWLREDGKILRIKLPPVPPVDSTED